MLRMPTIVDSCELTGFGREIISTAISSNKPKNTFKEADSSCRRKLFFALSTAELNVYYDK